VNSPRSRAAEGDPSHGAPPQQRRDAAERGAGGASPRGPSGRRVFVSLGSNLGDRATYLGAAREALAALPATRVVAGSRVYETAPQDLPDQEAFLNQVLCLETALQPLDLLRECQRIEREHGRTRELRFGPRTLDIDILLFQDAESDDPELTLPHPRMVKRAFVLVPLAEIWEQAKGMPTLDVEGLGKAMARTQHVRLYEPTKGER
jgi:2-amino-4-hydroxy-6-hydroxymethyldihydropteridine diphosphokinase